MKLTKATMKQLNNSGCPIKQVTIESLDNSTCFVKKFSLGETNSFSGMSPQEIALQSILYSIVDENKEPLFDNIEELDTLHTDVITEFASHISEFNKTADMESEAKK